mgnify:CR=1 FL=1
MKDISPTQWADRFNIPERARELRRALLFDLSFGPMGREYWEDAEDIRPWRGFSAGMRELSELLETCLPRTVWYDDDSDTFETSNPFDNPDNWETTGDPDADDSGYIGPESVYELDPWQHYLGELFEYA